ncbi:GntR family transcriptional regulator [Cupriavidus basilensis]|uniref:GntR family transcriptional regulator n=1 Tax=Cupriavidus basilensis TaxID=68895 RepID=UPI0020A62B9A|nr:GntR family transcriptional regulator [Cupriavidus basilensis]MCP3023474.1 GntR family transcriptional regulator [Cupriavidus basilensis]MDR3379521.1 GntR family transcriptional regulator [Cupriavidus basilensis]
MQTDNDNGNDNLSDSKAGASASQAVRALLGLRELILGGDLAPGARISELWVVERLGVSRTPIRAALIRLQEEGLVEPIPSGGFAVRSFAESEISDAIELRGTMEGMAARLAAERGVGQTILSGLRDCITQIDTALTGELTAVKFSTYVDLNARFHQLLAEAAGSPLVARQIEKVMNIPFASASAFVMVQSIDESAREMLLLAQAQHRSVVEAIELREGARAEALMREHSRIANRNLKIAMQNQQAMSQVLGGSLIRRAGRPA